MLFYDERKLRQLLWPFRNQIWLVWFFTVLTIGQEVSMESSIAITFCLQFVQVERIWLQPWTGATLLFALIRYISLLSRPIVLVAFFSPAWTKDVSNTQLFLWCLLIVFTVVCFLHWPLLSFQPYGRRAACNRFVKFSGASTVVIVGCRSPPLAYTHDRLNSLIFVL